MSRFVAFAGLSTRDPEVTIKVATGEKLFEEFTFAKAIYGNVWDSNIRLIVNSDGTLEEIQTE